MAHALTRFRTAFDAHVDVTESPGGAFDQVIEADPRLAKRVERLRGEHESMAAAVAVVDERLAGVPGPDWADEVRESVLELLGALARHRHRGADLLHEAFVVDISAGD